MNRNEFTARKVDYLKNDLRHNVVNFKNVKLNSMLIIKLCFKNENCLKHKKMRFVNNTYLLMFLYLN